MLNELDKAFLRRFVEEEGFKDSVEKALLIYIREQDSVINVNDTDEVLGQRTRAVETAKNLIRESFRNMVQYRSKEKITNQDNLER